MMTRRLSMILLVVLGVPAVAALLWVGWLQRVEGRAPAHVVTSRLLAEQLIEHASLTSSAIAPVPTLISGTLTEVITAGTLVEKGAIVFRFDDDQLLRQDETLQLEVAEWRARLERAQRARGAAELARELEIGIADAAIELAAIRQRLGAIPLSDNQRRILAIEEELAELDLSEDQEALARVRSLHERGLASASELEAAEQDLAMEEARLAELRHGAQLRARGKSAAELTEYATALDAARAERVRAAQGYARQIERAAAQMAIYESEIEEREFRLATVREQLANSIGRAPCAGMAMPRRYRDWSSGGRYVDIAPGLDRHPGDPIVDILDPEQVRAVVMINEVDFVRLELDQPVTVTLNAHPQRPLRGRISFLAGMSADRGSITINRSENDGTGVRVFEVRVDFDKLDGLAVRPGMTGRAAIDLGRRVERMIIPRRLVYDQEQTPWVWREEEGRVVRRQVQGQLYGDVGFWITRGLRPGDRLFTEGGT